MGILRRLPPIDLVTPMERNAIGVELAIVCVRPTFRSPLWLGTEFEVEDRGVLAGAALAHAFDSAKTQVCWASRSRTIWAMP